MKLRQACQATCNCGGGCCPGDQHATCATLFNVVMQWDRLGCPGEAADGFDFYKPHRCNTVDILIAWDDPPAWLTALLEEGETLRYSMYMSPYRMTRIEVATAEDQELCGRYWDITAADPVDPADYPPENTVCPDTATLTLMRQVDDPVECRTFALPDVLGENGPIIPRSNIVLGNVATTPMSGYLPDDSKGWMYPDDCYEEPDCDVPLGCHCIGRPGNLFIVVKGVIGETERDILTCSYCLDMPIDSCIDTQCCPPLSMQATGSVVITVVADGVDVLSATCAFSVGSGTVCWDYSAVQFESCEGYESNIRYQCRLMNTDGDSLSWLVIVDTPGTDEWAISATVPLGFLPVGEVCGTISPPYGTYTVFNGGEQPCVTGDVIQIRVE